MKAHEDSRVLGRREFLWSAGAIGLGGLVPGGKGTGSGLSAGPGFSGFSGRAIAAVLANTCVLTPSELEGPFWKNLNFVRRNITESQPGLPMSMYIRVVRASDCTPIQGAVVDVWHAEHLGAYSGFQGQGTQGETWLRGVQTTGPDGIALFQTIFPGWYPARVPHVHVKIFPDMMTELTTQLYFPDDLNDGVHRQAPYDQHGPLPHHNADDPFFHPETVFGVKKFGTASLLLPAAPRVRRLLAGQTIAIA